MHQKERISVCLMSPLDLCSEHSFSALSTQLFIFSYMIYIECKTMEHAQTYAMFRIIIGIKAAWKFSQSNMAAGESVVVGVRVRCGLEDVGSTGCLLDSWTRVFH